MKTISLLTFILSMTAKGVDGFLFGFVASSILDLLLFPFLLVWPELTCTVRVGLMGFGLTNFDRYPDYL